MTTKLEHWKNIMQAMYMIHHPYSICWTFGRPTECRTSHHREAKIIYQYTKGLKLFLEE